MSQPDVESLAPILSSPELREHLVKRATEFIDAVFDEAMIALEEGDATTRAAFVKMILPQLLKFQKDQDDEGVDAEKVKAETRAMFEEMGAALRGETGDDDGG